MSGAIGLGWPYGGAGPPGFILKGVVLVKDRVPSAPGFYPHGGFPGRLRFHDFLRILMSCGFKLPQNFYGGGFNHSMAWVSDISHADVLQVLSRSPGRHQGSTMNGALRFTEFLRIFAGVVSRVPHKELWFQASTEF